MSTISILALNLAQITQQMHAFGSHRLTRQSSMLKTSGCVQKRIAHIQKVH